MITVCGSTRASTRATENRQIDWKIERVIDNVRPLTGKFLTGGCGCGNDHGFAGELPPQLLDETLGRFDFAYGNGMDPDRARKLWKFKQTKAVWNSRHVFSKADEVVRQREDQAER